MIDLDVHTHLAPVDLARLAGIAGVAWQGEPGALVVDGHRLGLQDLYHPERLLAWMDARQIRRAWVSVPPPLYRQQLDADAAGHWVRYLNATLAQTVARWPDRLRALRYLPLEHPQLLAGLADAPGDFAGVALAAGGHDAIRYDRPEYDTLWQRLSDAGSFVFVHPGTCRDARLGRFYMENLVGNPYETGVAATHLVMAGVPARCPGIRFCLAHAGGVFSALCGRLEQGFATDRPGLDPQVERPLQAARRFQVDCIAHSADLLALARAVFGAEQVVFGSDWPFPMGLRDAPADAHARPPS